MKALQLLLAVLALSFDTTLPMIILPDPWNLRRNLRVELKAKV